MSERDERLPDVSDTIPHRLDGGPLGRPFERVKLWFLLTGNRAAVTLLLTAGIFWLTVVVGAFGPVTARRFLSQGVSPAQALVELLKSIVAIVTIVLSINQLVLSPQLGPVGDQREKLAETMELRSDVEKRLGEAVSPLAPAEFLRGTLLSVVDAADRLRTPSGDEASEVETALASLGDDVSDRAAELADALADARFGAFEVVPESMTFDVSGRLQRARKLQRADGLDAEQRRIVAELVDRLELFATTRSYLKTTYIRSQYVRFSRTLLFLGLPSLLVAFYATQVYDASVFPGRTLGVANRLWFVSGAVTVSLLPFAALIAYVSRLATLSQSTLFVGPFVAGGSSDGDDAAGDQSTDASRTTPTD